MWFVAAGLSLLVCRPGLAARNDCQMLHHREISSAQIGLPTHGAKVESATLIAGSSNFCKVRGRVLPLDPTAQPIRFEVNLPESWNTKAVQYGGGAFDGFLVTGLDATVVGDRHAPTPLAHGYATFGSDSGHHHRYLLLPDKLNALSAKFALNDEQRRNFASESLKKTHDVAVALMRLRYGTAPSRMYFAGGSTGGREAMMVVDRWPEDYDGVLAAYAAWNQIESDLQFIRISRALYAKSSRGGSGWLSGAKTTLLRNAVLDACDAQDGLKDGIVSDPADCRFDAATLRCADGKDRKGCLSDAQERTVAAFATDQVSDFHIENGINREPGYNVLGGADLVGSLGLLRHPFHPAVPLLNSFYYLVGDGVLRFFLSKDPHFDTLHFDPMAGGEHGRWIEAIRQQSIEDDASLADLSPFERHGGKLLLVHGTSDTTIPTGASVLLYHRLVETMGDDRVRRFARLYLVPGFGHGRGIFDAGFDTISVLDAWADKGVAPAGLVVTDQNKAAAGRTRPLCAWPDWPKYVGGDRNIAASFACVPGGE